MVSHVKSNCICDNHLRVDEARRKEGLHPLECVGHGGNCPCSIHEEISTEENTP